MYLVRIVNKDTRAHRYRLSAEGLPGIVIETDAREHAIGSGEVYSVAARVRVPATAARGSQPIRVQVQAVDDPGLVAIHEARFLAP